MEAPTGAVAAWRPASTDGLGAVVALGVLVLLLGRVDPMLVEIVCILGEGVLAVWCLRAPQRAWRLLGAFLALWTLGDVLWLAAEVGLSSAAGVLGDAVYALGVPLAVLGLLRLPGGRWESGAAPRVVLDVLVMAIPVLVVADVLVVPQVREVGLDPTDAMLLAWPVLDVLLMSLAFVLSRRRADRMRPDLALLVLAFATWTVGDTWLAWWQLTGGAYLGSAAQVPFVVAPFLVWLARRETLRRATRDAARGAGDGVAEGAADGVADGVARHATCRAVVVLPDVFVLAAGLVCIAEGPSTWHEWTLILLGASLAALRHGVVAFDAQHVRETLEARVGERTARLTEVSDRLELVVDTVGDAIVGLDHEGRIVFLNRAAHEVLRQPGDELLGRAVCAALCGESHTDCPLVLASRFGQRVDRTETVFRRGDGGLVPVELVVAPVRRGTEGDLGCVLTFHDVTDRRRVEQAKQQFVTAVSHELRTPLAAIRGALEMLADGDAGDLAPEAQHLVTTAERGTGRLTRLVDDLLDVERMASGSFEVEPRPADVGDLVRDVVAVLGDWALTHRVLLRTGRLDGVALADPRRVEQALTNLVANAVTFSDPGGVVHLGAQDQDGMVLLEVRDEGEGIPADDLPHVFERFHQVARGDATDHGGTGLGLAITRSIVERHGGRIWVESTLGEGSTFRFTLPSARTPVGVTPTEVTSEAAGAPTGRSAVG